MVKEYIRTVSAENGYAFLRFAKDVRDLLGVAAEERGYNTGGPDSDNRLYDFVRDFIGGHPHSHALGEVVYKVVRYRNKGNREDLLKAAAWLFLVLRREAIFEREEALQLEK